MPHINLYETTDVDELIWPEEEKEVTLDSSALLIFTDFIHTKPLVIESDISVAELQQITRKAHVRMKIVIDGNNRFQGIIGLEDISDRILVKKVAEGYERDELMVSQFMRSKASLKAFDYHEVSKATIGDIIETLRTNGQQHCLVIDRERHKIRGVISASDIARKLHIDIDITNDLSFDRLYQLYG